ncbi:MAG: TetR-like C-terminal domain-containing protein [Ruminococcus bromii]|nr:TetR-like C-terminal domain-containing protein [Ruminococcus bromii]
MNKAESKYFNTAVKMNDALLTILEKKPFEYITVSEICEMASVNRSTFYLHYENTTDLLAETTKRIIDGFLSYFPVDTEIITRKFSDCALDKLNYISAEYLKPYLSYIREHKTIFSTALAHTNTFGFENIFQRMFDNIFDPILARFNYSIGDRKYVMMYYLNGINAIVIQWLKDGCEKSNEDIARIIHECIFGLEL